MDSENGVKKPYIKPRIVYEADLEIRAGTPLFSPSSDDAIDLLDSSDSSNQSP